MELLFVKLTLTPLLMVAVSAASRRWGGAIGGLLAGLPLTAGPISIYLAAEQGRAFAAQSAVSSIAGVGAVTLSYLVYAETSRRASVLASIVLTVLAYGLAMGLLQTLQLSLGPILAVDMALILVALARSSMQAFVRPTPRLSAWDLPARLIASTCMVLFVTFSARTVGPAYSGLFSTIPLIGWPLIVFAHLQQGRMEALAVLRGILKGCLGLVVFYVIVDFMLPGHGAVPTYTIALAASVATTAAWLVKR